MKKLFILLLSVLMCLSLAACSSNGGGETPAEPADEPTEAATETFEELLAAGIANGNKLTIYSTHSVTVSALQAFMRKYAPEVEYEGTQIGDTNQVTQVAQEVKEGVSGADIIFIQDGARVLTDLVEEGYVYNWYNDEIKALVGDDCEPLLVWDYCNKVIMYNNGADFTYNEGDITNIWYCTDPANANAFCMKDPTTEGVNMNFLVNLTSDENAAALEAAYKDYYGTDLVLDDDCPNAGYQFIKMIYQNGMVLGSSDSTIAKDIAAAEKPMSGLLTLNKYLKSRGTREDGTTWNLLYTTNDVNPVAGFIYPIYALQVANADNPELAKAFLIWLYSEEGWYGDGEMTCDDDSVYKGMQGRYGDYSGNTSNPIADGDMSVVEWKKILVQEDAQQAAEYRADVEDFIQLIK
ncbi:MAG: substrate-binding domain-containing protein [Erysipelotrichaceae bacterium]|nr:substrate-binding domain-containing protein [Erysipelotrichaceae bacterium]MBQ6654026.1 substrate-binding domain-containing protein [Erysipelotrichaceae bacterium]